MSTSYRVNQAGVDKARRMIDAGQYDLDTEWDDGQPSADAENDHIERHGDDGFGEWHLAIDTAAGERTKERFGFPYGDFRRVFRTGLIAARQRAAQFGHDDVARAAGELLEHLDARRS